MKNYPGYESSNSDYYDQFDNSIEKVYSEPIKIEWGILKFWRYKFNLVKSENFELNPKLKSLLEEEGILPFYLNVNGEKQQYIPNIMKLTFYNKRLYQGQVLYVPYVSVGDKVYILWVVHQNIVHKFSHPIEKLVWQEKLYQQIGKLIGCHHCMLQQNGNQISYFEIKHHQKVKHFKLFGFIKGEMIYDKHTEKIYKWKIIFNNSGWAIVLNNHNQVVYELENYGDMYVVKDRNWRILWQLQNDNIVSFNIPETWEKVVLKISGD